MSDFCEPCDYRQQLDANSSGDRMYCRLVQEVSGVSATQLCTVDPSLCVACGKWFAPSSRHLNPVVASKLYTLSTEVIRRGGVAGCSVARAQEVRGVAFQNLVAVNDGSQVMARSELHKQEVAPAIAEPLLPRTRRRSKETVRKWAVGVTTAKRDEPTLEPCVESLAVAGWDEIRLFIDGPVVLPPHLTCIPATHRAPTIGAWPSYYLSLLELLMRAPEADAFMLVQDDTLIFRYRGLRHYLEQDVLWPGRRPGIASLFCSRAYTRSSAGWFRFRGIWRWCALAFVFSREAAQRFVADPWTVRHRWSRRANGLADIPWVVGRWAYRRRVPFYYPTPSLVQHIGHVSSLWDNVLAVGQRRADRFIGDLAVDANSDSS